MRKYPPTRTSPLPNLNIKLNIVCDPETPEQKTTENIYNGFKSVMVLSENKK